MKSRASMIIVALALWEMVGAAVAVDPAITRGPYLQMGTPTAVSVRWRTDAATDSRVRFGTSPGALTMSADDAASTTEHEVRLTGLTPNTQYFYSVGPSTATLAGGPEFTFFTAPPTGTAHPTRVWVLGDSGTADTNAAAVRNAYTAFAGTRHTDLWLMLGDNAYENGSDQDFQDAVFEMYPAYLRQSVLWPALGNHDTAGSTNPPASLPYFQIFTLPTQGEAGGVPSGTEKYYSFDQANIHFVCIDSMSSSLAAGSAMLSWLQQDLASTTQHWIIAYWHHPPYTKGGFNSDNDADLKEMREKVVPILEAGGVDLVFSGHAHSYERSFLLAGHYGTAATLNSAMKKDAGDGRAAGTGIYGKDPGPHNGTVYVASGSSGKLGSGPLDHPVMVTSLLVLGSVVIDVDGDELDVRFLDKNGQIRDEFGISKAPLVTVAAAQSTASEVGPTEATVMLSRTRGLNHALAVNLTLSGSATPGNDCQAVTVPVSIPVNANSVTVPITPIPDAIAEGSETVVITAHSGTGYRVNNATRQATVTIEDKPADHWRFSKFGTNANNPAIAGELADPDRDDLNNLLERGLGTEPLAVTQNPAAALNIGGYLALRFPRSMIDTSLTYTVEVSGDLQSWQPGSDYFPGGSTPITQFTTEVSRQLGEPEIITVRDNVLTSIAPRRFIRLRISSP